MRFTGGIGLEEASDQLLNVTFQIQAGHVFRLIQNLVGKGHGHDPILAFLKHLMHFRVLDLFCLQTNHA